MTTGRVDRWCGGSPVSLLNRFKGRKQSVDPFQAAVEVGPSREALAEEFAAGGAPQPTGIPTVWQDGASGQKFAGKPAAVHIATAGETEQLAAIGGTFICGFCKYFDLENGRKEIARQRFAERLVNDEQWKLRHLGAPIDTIGLCGASNGEVATSFVSKGCDQYRQKGK